MAVVGWQIFELVIPVLLIIRLNIPRRDKLLLPRLVPPGLPLQAQLLLPQQIPPGNLAQVQVNLQPSTRQLIPQRLQRLVPPGIPL